MIPPPPELKPTIIQMQNVDNTDESAISPDLANAPAGNLETTDDQGTDKSKKKRRRSSSSLVSQNEIEKRRREHKTAHSIIEKKRRIRMNREFEALKFLVPACRNNLNTSSNGGEGMYKLTILQATVDYIKYLHSVINIQQDELIRRSPEWEQELLDFSKVDVNTDEYRNLDNEFNFNRLFEEHNANSQRSSLSVSSEINMLNSLNMAMPMNMNGSTSLSSPSTAAMSRGTYSRSTVRKPSSSEPNTLRLRTNSTVGQSFVASTDPLAPFQTLPSPIITPELYPSSSSGPLYKSVNTLSSAGPSTTETNSDNYNTIQSSSGLPSFPTSSSLSSSFKHDFQFPMNPTSKSSPSILTVPSIQPSKSDTSSILPTRSAKTSSLSSSSSPQTFEQLVIPPLETSDNTTSKLESIHELKGFGTEESASKALLSMKKDGSVASIRSLLN